MKNSKGISVVSVIITIIMIIILASITVYTGSNMLNQAKSDRAYDRLDVIYQALKANEDILGIGDEVPETSITNEVYSQIGLERFGKEKDPPLISYQKEIGGIEDSSNALKRTYTLKYELRSDSYTKQYEYEIVHYTYSTVIDFDKNAGVNRPQLTDEMQAINFVNSEDGVEVQDIFEEKWYSYDSSAPNYANMKLGDNYYVWIPRYAYKIQPYYLENMLPNVPSSAIDIIFLKGTSNRDANDNSIPSDYKVHPAFKYGDIDLPGIWVEKYHHPTSKRIGNIFSDMYNTLTENGLESHMLKNVEWGAVAYLAQTCGAAKLKSSTGNASGVMDINENEIEYVSAYALFSSSVLETNGSFLASAEDKLKDTYYAPTGTMPIKNYNKNSYGDAFIETSSADSDHSAWYNSETELLTSGHPFIARGVGSSVFSYIGTAGVEPEAYYRRTILGIGTQGSSAVISFDTDAKYVKVSGDTYLCEPTLTGFNEKVTYYVTWDDSGVETKTPITEPAPDNWYNYTKQRWANIVVEGNENTAYFVWIPRYAYKLDSESQNSIVRFVDIYDVYEDASGNKEKIVYGTKVGDWKLPEAFTWNGQPLQGYWMSKYQISKQDGFYVERFSHKIAVKLIDEKEARLGNGTYSYYLGDTLVGTAAYNKEFTYTNLQASTMYRIRIVGSNGKVIERNIQTIGTIPKLTVTTPNAPVLTGFETDKTYYVTWNAAGQETLTPISQPTPSDWYNYSTQKWANIVVDNNQGKLYLTWIPRFKYKLDYADKKYSDFNTVGDTPFGFSYVKFIPANVGTAGEADDEGYMVPQAFNWNGIEIPGYWMTKYQISMKDNFFVERGPSYIMIRSIDAALTATLGSSGSYTYYLDGVNKGTAAYNKNFMFSGLTSNTTYEIRIVGNTNKEVVRTISTLDNNKIVKLSDTTTNIATPDLTGFEEANTYYVTWDSSGNEILTSISNSAPSDWYDYTNQKWANILVKNGTNKAYFVWIPRYRYLLDSETKHLLKNGDDYIEGYDSIYGYSKVEFISKSTGTAGSVDANGYAIPQAFNWNGTEISGFWMSKYQISAND